MSGQSAALAIISVSIGVWLAAVQTERPAPSVAHSHIVDRREGTFPGTDPGPPN